MFIYIHNTYIILKLQLHMLARKTTLPPKFVERTLPWARVLSDMFDNKHWDVVFEKLDVQIKGCLFSSKFLKYWREILHHKKWRGRNSESGNSLPTLYASKTYIGELYFHCH